MPETSLKTPPMLPHDHGDSLEHQGLNFCLVSARDIVKQSTCLLEVHLKVKGSRRH